MGIIRLQTLGELGLRGADGQELRSLLVQPKRVALLTYLAIARPRGFHRRDSLLALLWPDQDAFHARAALRQVIHSLRCSVGEALLARGEDLALDPAQAFEQPAGQLHLVPLDCQLCEEPGQVEHAGTLAT